MRPLSISQASPHLCGLRQEGLSAGAHGLQLLWEAPAPASPLTPSLSREAESGYLG